MTLTELRAKYQLSEHASPTEVSLCEVIEQDGPEMAVWLVNEYAKQETTRDAWLAWLPYVQRKGELR